LTADEEVMIEALGKEMDRRRADLVALGKTKNDVSIVTITAYLPEASNLYLQLESRKNFIEIERLWRSRQDLQTRFETQIEESCEYTSRENLDVRTQELRVLSKY
jgi:hypothetical protein